MIVKIVIRAACRWKVAFVVKLFRSVSVCSEASTREIGEEAENFLVMKCDCALTFNYYSCTKVGV